MRVIVNLAIFTHEELKVKEVKILSILFVSEIAIAS